MAAIYRERGGGGRKEREDTGRGGDKGEEQTGRRQEEEIQ